MQKKLEEVTKQLNVLTVLEEQNVPSFNEILSIDEYESWFKQEQSGDEWITHYHMVFYKVETESGNFCFSIDYSENYGEFYLKIGYLSVPNATKEQIESLYEALQVKRERVVLLHDYLNLETFLKNSEALFTCTNTTTNDWYEKRMTENLTIGNAYFGYRINSNMYFVKLDNYHVFDEEKVKRFFRIE